MVSVKILAFAGADRVVRRRRRMLPICRRCCRRCRMCRRSRTSPAAGICAATSAWAISRFKSLSNVTLPTRLRRPASWRIDQRTSTARRFRLRHRLPVEQLAALRRHRRISRQGRRSRRSAAIPMPAASPLLRRLSTAIKSRVAGPRQRYLDLGTWWCFTPFVGAGIGVSPTHGHSFTDIGTTGRGAPASRYADADASKWNFAWALHAGLAYKVTHELQGRARLSLPQPRRRARPATSSTYDGSNTVNQPDALPQASPRTTSSSACAGCSSAEPVPQPSPADLRCRR